MRVSGRRKPSSGSEGAALQDALKARARQRADSVKKWVVLIEHGGFSLHAVLDIEPHQREKLERLCRYMSRLPVAEERRALTSSGQVRYQLALAAVGS